MACSLSCDTLSRVGGEAGEQLRRAARIAGGLATHLAGRVARPSDERPQAAVACLRCGLAGPSDRTLRQACDAAGTLRDVSALSTCDSRP